MKCILSIFFIFTFTYLYAQEDSIKRWEFQAAAGPGIPLYLHSTYQVNQKVGITSAISCHYYFSKQFYFGLMYTYSANQFKDIEYVEINPVLQYHALLAKIGGTYRHNNFFLQEDIGFGLLGAYMPGYTFNYTSTDYLENFDDDSYTLATSLKLLCGNNISEKTTVYFSAALLFSKPKWDINYYGEGYDPFFGGYDTFQGTVIKSPYYLPLNIMLGVNIRL